MDIFCICIAEFDLLKGNTLSYCYPPNKEPILQQLTNHFIGDFCLPDGSHLFEEDISHILLHPNQQQLNTTNSTTTISTINRYSRVHRGAIQKSIIIFSSQPFFQIFENILKITLNKILDLNNIYLQVNITATKKENRNEFFKKYNFELECINLEILNILQHVYQQCHLCDYLNLKLFPILDQTNNTLQNSTLQNNTLQNNNNPNIEYEYNLTLNIPRQIDNFTNLIITHYGTSIINLIDIFGMDIMLIVYNALLLDKKIFIVGQPSKLVSNICFSLPLLILPFIYNINNIYPNIPLPYMEQFINSLQNNNLNNNNLNNNNLNNNNLNNNNTGYIIGSTNILFENPNMGYWDICLSISKRKVLINNNSINSNNNNNNNNINGIEKLSGYQKVFILNLINNLIERTNKENKKKLNEQFIREQFKNFNLQFINEILAKSKLLTSLQHNLQNNNLQNNNLQNNLQLTLQNSLQNIKKIQKQWILQNDYFKNYLLNYKLNNLESTNLENNILILLEYLQTDKINKKQKLKYLFEMDKLLQNDLKQIDLLLSIPNNSNLSIFNTIIRNQWLIDDNNQFRKYSASICSHISISIKGQVQLLSLFNYFIKILLQDEMPNVKRIGYFLIMKLSFLFIGFIRFMECFKMDKILFKNILLNFLIENCCSKRKSETNFYELKLYGLQTLLQFIYFYKIFYLNTLNNNNLEFITEKEIEPIFSSITFMENNSININEYKYLDKIILLLDTYEYYNNYNLLTNKILNYNLKIYHLLKNNYFNNNIKNNNLKITKLFNHLNSILENVKYEILNFKKNDFHHFHKSIYLIYILQSNNLINLLFNEFILNNNKIIKNIKLLNLVLQLLFYILDTNIGMYYLLSSNYIEYCLTFIKYFNHYNNCNSYLIFKCYCFLNLFKRLLKYEKSCHRLLQSNILFILGNFIIKNYHNPLFFNLNILAIDIFKYLLIFYNKFITNLETVTKNVTKNNTNKESDDEEEEMVTKNPLYEKNQSLFFKKKILEKLVLLPKMANNFNNNLNNNNNNYNNFTTLEELKQENNFEKYNLYNSYLENCNYYYHYSENRFSLNSNLNNSGDNSPVLSNFNLLNSNSLGNSLNSNHRLENFIKIFTIHHHGDHSNNNGNNNHYNNTNYGNNNLEEENEMKEKCKLIDSKCVNLLNDKLLSCLDCLKKLNIFGKEDSLLSSPRLIISPRNN
ncbi:hypothetical protein ABK040_016641 [Willaertia magna]